MRAREIIVIGASAGGVEALTTLARVLPADLPAAVFVVLHVPPNGSGALPLILNRNGPLPAAHAVDGAAFECGRIYVAPPDHHLLLLDPPPAERARLSVRPGGEQAGPPPGAVDLCRGSNKQPARWCRRAARQAIGPADRDRGGEQDDCHR